MPIVFYTLEGSPPCRAVHMLIELLGLKVEQKVVNTLAGDQFKPEYLQKNHLHTIPLIQDGDFILSDSHAILTYLTSKYGADKRAQLYPSDLRVRATVDQRLFFDTSLVFPKFRGAIISLLKEKAPALTEQQVAEIEEVYSFVEKYLQASPFLAADHLTLADISVVATVSTLNCMVPIDAKYAKLHEWFERLQEKDWYQKGNAPGLAIIDEFLKSAK